MTPRGSGKREQRMSRGFGSKVAARQLSTMAAHKSGIVREGDELQHSAHGDCRRNTMPASSSIAADRTDAKGQVLTRLDAGYKRNRTSEGPTGRAGGPALVDVPSLDRTKTQWTS